MPIKITEKCLAQKRPITTTATVIYQPPSGARSQIRSIHVSNTTSSAATYRIFVDKDGTNATTDNALYYDIDILANSTHLIEYNDPGLILESSAASLSVRTGTASALNFTIMGLEIRET